jgi:hypothetical protein
MQFQDRCVLIITWHPVPSFKAFDGHASSLPSYPLRPPTPMCKAGALAWHITTAMSRYGLLYEREVSQTVDENTKGCFNASNTIPRSPTLDHPGQPTPESYYHQQRNRQQVVTVSILHPYPKLHSQNPQYPTTTSPCLPLSTSSA